MKKFFMTLAAVAVAATMNAQVWVGGELGFSSSHVCGDKSTEKNVFVKPEIGYSLDENFDVALALGFAHSSNLDIMGIAAVNVNQFSINPYLRYKFVKAGNFFAFIDCGIAYATAHIQGDKKNYNQFGAAVTPGIAYAVSDKVTLVSHLGDGLYYNHQWKEDYGHQNNFGFNMLNSISFGAYLSL